MNYIFLLILYLVTIKFYKQGRTILLFVIIFITFLGIALDIANEVEAIEQISTFIYLFLFALAIDLVVYKYLAKDKV